MFPRSLLSDAEALLAKMRAGGLHLALAESCTGGLIAACLTEIPGASDVVERGFVTYSNEAKIELLGVPKELIEKHGAVSQEVAIGMAAGALAHSRAQVSVSCTGIAGPNGGTAEKPVGLVFIGAARTDGNMMALEYRFGEIGRAQIRLATVEAAVAWLHKLV